MAGEEELVGGSPVTHKVRIYLHRLKSFSAPVSSTQHRTTGRGGGCRTGGVGARPTGTSVSPDTLQ